MSCPIKVKRYCVKPYERKGSTVKGYCVDAHDRRCSGTVVVKQHKRNWYGSSDKIDTEEKKHAFREANKSLLGRYKRGIAHPTDKHKEMIKEKNKIILKDKKYHNKYWDSDKGDWVVPWKNVGQKDRRIRK